MVGWNAPAGALLKDVIAFALLLPACVPRDPKACSRLAPTPLMVVLIGLPACVYALLKTCAAIVPIEVLAGVVVVAAVVVEDELVVLPSLLGEALTLLTPLLATMV